VYTGDSVMVELLVGKVVVKAVISCDKFSNTINGASYSAFIAECFSPFFGLHASPKTAFSQLFNSALTMIFQGISPLKNETSLVFIVYFANQQSFIIAF
jgi:hypothetical protein